MMSRLKTRLRWKIILDRSLKLIQRPANNKYKKTVMVNVGPVAQLVERQAHNLLVAGSNPVGPTCLIASSSFFTSSFGFVDSLTADITAMP